MIEALNDQCTHDSCTSDVRPSRHRNTAVSQFTEVNRRGTVAVGPGLAGGVAVTRWAGSVRAECGPGGSRPEALLFSDLGDRRSGFIAI